MVLAKELVKKKRHCTPEFHPDVYMVLFRDTIHHKSRQGLDYFTKLVMPPMYKTREAFMMFLMPLIIKVCK